MSAAAEMTPAQARATARRMYEAGGWAIVEIQAYLTDRGVSRCWETIRGWADPEWAECRREAHRQTSRRSTRKRAGGVRAYRVLDDDAKLDTLRRLRSEGLSMAAVAGAVRVFIGDDLSRHQVEYALANGRYPKERAT